ncbi:MAG: hypothetical protein BTN85_0115 [Candidatus Methanohalarchaeum thermophilum]|uniref:Uncharacterized protein n=1 Tax=Methanohalarchaeum thermophilum TaxID=1903181 RepID=A0A1Q6DTH4_METT1|nr:MAG: hypothetical protein BTN85_0115 [Candidatus Methanohalarchaeum thermophilum]
MAEPFEAFHKEAGSFWCGQVVDASGVERSLRIKRLHEKSRDEVEFVKRPRSLWM